MSEKVQNKEKIKASSNTSQDSDLNAQDNSDLEDNDIDNKIDQQMIDFIDDLEAQIYDEEMLFKYTDKNKKKYANEEDNENYNEEYDIDNFNEEDYPENDNFDEGSNPDNNITNDENNNNEKQDPIENYHQVYKVAIDFIEELKNPISYETSTHCFNHMNKLINIINKLLDYQEKVPYDNAEIENWRNIMIQTLLISKSFYLFLKNEKDAKCIEIAESLLDFAFNVEFSPSLESKIFSVLPELGTFLTSNEPIFSLESSTGSGKTRCVPFFLSIRSFQEKFQRPFIIMTQPSANLINSKVKDFQNILKNVKILTDVNEIISFGKTKKIQQPILCLLTPYNALILIERARTSGINLFKRSRWVLDEVHDRTIFIDTIIGFLHQELDKIENFPCQITLMTATMDKSIQQSLGKAAKSITLKDFTPYRVKETFDRENEIRDIPALATNYLFSILEDMRNKKIEPGHILIFVAGNADCQLILRDIASRAENNNEEKETKIMHINIHFDDFYTEEMIYQDIEKEAFNPNYLYILPIQLAGYVSQVQKAVAQNPLPKNLKNVIKIIVSTNIIESSITILDLAAVIDSGLYNRAKFDPQTEITRITKESISQKMATQRRGRVGRTKKGVYVGISTCFYQEIEPQIKTSDLSSSLLSLRSIGIKLEKVDKLPDKPDLVQIEKNINDLTNIGALDHKGDITEKGKDISLLSNDFSPFFASVLLDIRQSTNSEYYEILAALIILIITSQQLIYNYRSPALQKNYNKSSDIITLLLTFNELFEENYQDQKEKCVQYGIDQICYTRLLTSFSNFIHKIFKRDSSDLGFLGRHVKEVRKLISSINLMEFVNYVIYAINRTKPNWIADRTFSFSYVSGLDNIPSVVVSNQSNTKTVIVGSRPGWKGLECDDLVFVFSIIARNQTLFGTIVHKYPYPQQQIAPMYKCVSFEFNENISIPFFEEMLKCLNSSKTFLPMYVKPTNQSGSLTTLFYQSTWMNSTYLSICTSNEYNVEIMKRLIRKVKEMMPFVGKSLLVDAPDVEALAEIYSIGGSRYSTRIHTLNDHPFAYQFNEEMFKYLCNHMSDLAKTDPPIRIAINNNYICSPVYYDTNPFIVISNNEIHEKFAQFEWSNLIKPKVERKVDHFLEEVNSIAPNIINANENMQYAYFFMGDHQRPTDLINSLLKTNFSDEKITKSIEISKIYYGEDIDYDVESNKIEKEISKNESKIKYIRQTEITYNNQLQQYYHYKNVEYPKLSKSYNRRMRKYNKLKDKFKSKRFKAPKKPGEPREPIRPDFNKNKQIIDACTKTIKEFKEKLNPMILYIKKRRENLINELRLHSWMRYIKACGTEGCVLPMSINIHIETHDTTMWKCDVINQYCISITHHMFHSMTRQKFIEIIDHVSKSFGFFANRIGEYCSLSSFGLLGSLNVQVVGKQFVIPFIKTVLDELDKGAVIKKSHDFELPNTIISKVAITHPTNVEYFIKLMRKNRIEVTLDGPVVKGTLDEVRNAFQLINQRRFELLFPFLSIKIPKSIFNGKFVLEMKKINSTKPKNKQWVNMKNEIVFPREDFNECQNFINSLAAPKMNIHGCIYFCDDPALSNYYLPVYNDPKTPVLSPFCVNCLKETLHYATDNFFDLKSGHFSKEFLENNVEMIPPISICSDNVDEKTSQTWPIVPLAQLFYVLQYEFDLNPMSRAWIKGVIEQTIRTCPSIITCCPEHPQKKFLMGNNPIHCNFESCELCFCVSCKSWHDPAKVCENLDKSFRHCPKCGIPTIKNDGCNHIQCKCGAHWCYKCGAGPFTEGSECYAHMSQVHNSFMD